MKKRYIFYLSYIGTFFKSSSKQTKEADVTSVVGSLECALKELSPKLGIQYVSSVNLSSRTDHEVHALQNTAHVDVTFVKTKGPYELTSGINRFCSANRIPLRVVSIRQVSDDFNSRKFATQRTYLYRIGVPKSNDLDKQGIPISEIDRCHFLKHRKFDVDALQQVVSIFPGVHDFTSFCLKPKKQLLVRTPIRRVDSFSISCGEPLMSSLYEPFADNFDYWNLIVQGRSFVYCQVRLMVTHALAVAQGCRTVADVQRLLDIPNKGPKHLNLVPACGLYLMKVTYDESSLAIDRRRLHFKEHVQLVHLLDQYKLALENFN